MTTPRPMKIYSRVGVGDVIILNDFLRNWSWEHPFSSREVLFMRAHIGDRGDSYVTFLEKLASTIFPQDVSIGFTDETLGGSEKNFYVVNIGSERHPIHTNQVMSTLNLQSQATLLCSDTPEFLKFIATTGCRGEYIVVTTRVRAESLSIYETVSAAMDILNQQDRPVVVIGERANKFEFFSAYDRIKASLTDGKIIDLTTDLTFSNFQTENSIIRDSKLTISFGIGGNMVVPTYLTDNFVCLLDKWGSQHPFIPRAIGAGKNYHEKSQPFFADIVKFLK